jgi:hypothetical protein
MKVYEGRRRDGPGSTLVVVLGDSPNGRKLNPRWDIRNHSPNGFEWGYGGSGPAQLALAILCDLIGEDQATRNGLYQTFKFKVIAGLKTDSWVLTEEEIQQAVAAIKQEEN